VCFYVFLMDWMIDTVDGRAIQNFGYEGRHL
jgi:hypothetical protein